jgi:hypothetical protein
MLLILYVRSPLMSLLFPLTEIFHMRYTSDLVYMLHRKCQMNGGYGMPTNASIKSTSHRLSKQISKYRNSVDTVRLAADCLEGK